MLIYVYVFDRYTLPKIDMDNIPNHQVLFMFRVHVSFRLTISGLLVIGIFLDLYPLNHVKS